MHIIESLALVKVCLQWSFDEITPGKGPRPHTLRSHCSGFVQCSVNTEEGVADSLRELGSLPRKDDTRALTKMNE